MKYSLGVRDQAFLLNDYAITKRFYRALGDGDTQACLAEMGPALQATVDPCVLNAFGKHFQDQYGPFQAIEFPHYTVRASFMEKSPGIVSAGVIRFANGTLRLETQHQYGMLINFSAQANAPQTMEGFAAKIEDKAELDKFARRFLSGVFTTDFPTNVGMLSDAMRQQLGDPQAFTDGAFEFRKLNGAVKAMKLVKAEYSQQTDSIKMAYEIQCENRVMDGEVNLEFNAVQASVEAFSVNARKIAEAEDADIDTEKDPLRD